MICPRLIVTHPGAAHRDDLLACSILLGKFPDVCIVRREPTAEDMADPLVWVIDVGGQHDPAMGLFDHHQFPVVRLGDGQSPQCALTLILRHLDLEAAAREAWTWLAATERRDVCGPAVLAQEWSVPLGLLLSMQSPVEEWLLGKFAQQSEIKPGDLLHAGLTDMGGSLVNGLEQWHGRLALLKAEARVIDINGWPVMFGPVGASPRPFMALRGWETIFEKSNPERGQIVACVFPDDRSHGWALSRLHDHEAVDFCRLGTEPGISFIHQSGFVAKSSDRVDEETVKRWLSIAISPRPE